MIRRSTWLHLRIPFSFFLLPVYLFATAVCPEVDGMHAVLTFIILHFFLYPASNGYNSYFDKDEESIGGLEKPPPVSRELYYTALLLDLVAIGLGLLVNIPFAIMLLIYGLVSKAYSHPGIRLKKYALAGWLVAGLFQGAFTFFMVCAGLQEQPPARLWTTDLILPALLTTLLLWGSYPMTQIYQHAEDARRGDETLSRKLGILGTFHFTMAVFFIANAGFIFYFSTFYSLAYVWLFELFLAPVLIYFMWWYRQTRKDLTRADFRHTMKLNSISACCLNLFFVWMLIEAIL